MEPTYVRPLPWEYDDGGRGQAGMRGSARDCVVRAIAIASDRRYDYPLICEQLGEEAQRERPRKGRSRSSAQTGIHIPTIRRYLDSLGWEWTPTMGIGTGCTVHLRYGELPKGRLVVSVSRHLVAVVDGTVRDTHDPTRGGMRCVYGYWREG